ncbi:unnamed protein product [Euphydryas editha]|uniref:Uncharacterized protein n=1 Tax=Euphydryas editha TaxID=104508 RepID=A0AAU9USM6_EUPED|nr:unnamed protein product [Euphydryas editha]
MDMEATGSRSAQSFSELTVKKMDLVMVLKRENFYKQSSSQCIERLTTYILDNFSEYKQSKESKSKIKSVLKVFVSKLLQKWKKSNWKMERFMKCNSEWLKNDLVLPAESSINAKDVSKVKKLEADL